MSFLFPNPIIRSVFKGFYVGGVYVAKPPAPPSTAANIQHHTPTISICSTCGFLESLTMKQFAQLRACGPVRKYWNMYNALFSLLETIPDFPDSVCRAPERNSALERLIELRLNHPDSERITSFERLMVRASDSQATMEELFLPENHREARQCLNSLKALFTDRVDGSSLDR